MKEADAKALVTAAPALLEEAAKLIEQVAIRLDMTKITCQCCGHTVQRNMTHARIYEQITDLPTRLRGAANRLVEQEYKKAK